jgi:hypothetical protein
MTEIEEVKKELQNIIDNIDEKGIAWAESEIYGLHCDSEERQDERCIANWKPYAECSPMEKHYRDMMLRIPLPNLVFGRIPQKGGIVKFKRWEPLEENNDGK